MLKKLLSGFLVIVLAIVTAVGVAAKVTLGHNRIVQGVSVSNVDLSGLTKDEATNTLRLLDEKLKSENLTLTYQAQQWQLPLRDLGVSLDIKPIVEDAYALGRKGFVWEQYKERQGISQNPVEIPLQVEVQSDLLQNKIKEATKTLEIQPVNATFRVNDQDQVEIVAGKPGSQVELANLADQVQEQLEAGQQPQIGLNLKQVQPEVTTSSIENMGINGLIASYNTKFDSKAANRTYNIHVAASALDNLLIKPGEEVSFNKIVGPRSSEAGYKEAPVILNNELVPGLGGGVCQVSTTLYNSLLLGDFEIVSRQNHSIPSHYVPLGRDATVTYGGIDFKFKNNHPEYILLKSQVKGNAITFKIFGNVSAKKDVDLIDTTTQVIEPKVQYENDPNLAKGKQVVKEEGRKGYKTVTVRLIKEAGKVVRREVVAKSYYKPKNKIIAVGTKPVVVQPNPNPVPNPAPNPITPKPPNTQPNTQPSTQPNTQPNTQPSTQPNTQPNTQPTPKPNTQPSTQPKVPETKPSSPTVNQPSTPTPTAQGMFLPIKSQRFLG